MRRDTIAFRERFNRWKAGEKVYEMGRALPEFQDGTGKIDWKHWDYAELTSYTIPFIQDKAIKLTNAGPATGAVLSTNLLDSIADNAIRAGLPLQQALGIGVKESTLGNPTDTKSAWNMSSGIRRQFNNVYPGTAQHINAGQGADERELVNYHKGLQFDFLKNPSSRNSQQKSVLEEAFDFYNQHPNKYNPGQKNYSKLVEKRGKEIMQSPEIQKWLKDYSNKKVSTYVKAPKPYKVTRDWNTLPKFKDGQDNNSSNMNYEHRGTVYDDNLKNQGITHIFPKTV